MTKPDKPAAPGERKTEAELRTPRQRLASGPSIRDMTKERAGHSFGIMVPNAMPRPKDSNKS